MDAREDILRNFGRQMFLGVVEHGRADAVFTTCAVQYVDIDTTLATPPEGLVVSQVGKGDGLIA